MQTNRTKHKVREPNIRVHNQAKHKHNRKLLIIEITNSTSFPEMNFYPLDYKCNTVLHTPYCIVL